VELARDILSWICIVTGAAFSITGGIGIVRFPDFFSRMHAAGLTDTMGALMILAGLALQAGFSAVTFKLVLVLLFTFVSSPTSAHALAASALAAGERPLLDEAGEEPPSAT
jgi:multicomponent Na+:H+ antiporter subunit G